MSRSPRSPSSTCSPGHSQSGAPCGCCSFSPPARREDVSTSSESLRYAPHDGVLAPSRRAPPTPPRAPAAAASAMAPCGTVVWWWFFLWHVALAESPARSEWRERVRDRHPSDGRSFAEGPRHLLQPACACLRLCRRGSSRTSSLSRYWVPGGAAPHHKSSVTSSRSQTHPSRREVATTALRRRQVA